MTTAMVIAHVLSSFGQGGQERVAADLARLQHAAGHEVLAISLASGPEGPTAAAFRAAGAAPETIAKRPRIDPSCPCASQRISGVTVSTWSIRTTRTHSSTAPQRHGSPARSSFIPSTE